MNMQTINLAEYLRDKAQKKAIEQSGLSNVFQPDSIKGLNTPFDSGYHTGISQYLAIHARGFGAEV